MRTYSSTFIILLFAVMVALAGCAGKKNLRDPGEASEAEAHVRAGEAPESAFERAAELENQERYALAETLYRDIARSFPDKVLQSIEGDDNPRSETLSVIIARRLPFLECKKNDKNRFFKDREKFIGLIVEAVRSANARKIEPLLACESVRGDSATLMERPRLPAEQAQWLATLRRVDASKPELLPFVTADQSENSERLYLATSGYHSHRQLLFDLRNTPRGWMWWAIVGN